MKLSKVEIIANILLLLWMVVSGWAYLTMRDGPARFEMGYETLMIASLLCTMWALRWR